MRLFIGASGLNWWSPSQVHATNYVGSVCVSVCVCTCNCFVWYIFITTVHLGNKVIILPGITADITGQSKFCNARLTIENPFLPEIGYFSNSIQSVTVIAATHLPSPEGLKSELWL